MARRPLIPPPVALGLFGLAAWWVAGSLPALAFDFMLRLPLSWSLAGLGALFLLTGIGTIMLSGTTVNPLTPGKAARLVTHGVYSISRNPIYVGDVLLLAAWGFRLGNYAALAFPPLLVLWLDRFQIAPEEKALAAKFGAGFDEYRRKVRRWI